MRWSVAAVGLLLLLGSGADVVLDSEGPLIDTAEVVPPVLCGVTVVGYGSGVVTAECLLIRRKQRHVQRQNGRLESFASMSSHDLRTPPNVATGRVVARRRPADPTPPQYSVAPRPIFVW